MHHANEHDDYDNTNNRYHLSLPVRELGENISKHRILPQRADKRGDRPEFSELHR